MTTEEQSPAGPGVWTRVGRAVAWSLTTTIKLLFVLAVTALVIAGAFLLGQAAVNEYDNVQLRLAKLETDAEFAITTNTQQNEALAGVGDDTRRLSTDLSALQTQLAADLTAQGERLAQLETELALALDTTATLSQSVSVLNEVAAALQTDVTANVSSIDALGGTTDALTGRVGALEEDLTAAAGDISGLEAGVTALGEESTRLAAAATRLEQMEDTLTLFRVWGLVSRARLRLLEDNPGLAESDVATARALLQQLTEATPIAEASESPLANLQTRLDLVTAALPDDVATAALDLDTAWSLLDTLLGERLGQVEVE